jgi:hypothetical protein
MSLDQVQVQVELDQVQEEYDKALSKMKSITSKLNEDLDKIDLNKIEARSIVNNIIKKDISSEIMTIAFALERVVFVSDIEDSTNALYVLNILENHEDILTLAYSEQYILDIIYSACEFAFKYSGNEFNIDDGFVADLDDLIETQDTFNALLKEVSNTI